MAETSSMKPAWILVGILLAALVFANLFHKSSPLVGKEGPNFTLPLVSGAHPLTPGEPNIHLASLRGKTVVLDFWATWCPPCRAEAPVLHTLHETMKDKGVVVMGVNTNDEEGAAAPFARAKHLAYPIVYDEGDKIKTLYGVERLPTLVVISPTGVVSTFRTGVANLEELSSLVEKANH